MKNRIAFENDDLRIIWVAENECYQLECCNGRNLMKERQWTRTIPFILQANMVLLLAKALGELADSQHSQKKETE